MKMSNSILPTRLLAAGVAGAIALAAAAPAWSAPVLSSAAALNAAAPSATEVQWRPRYGWAIAGAAAAGIVAGAALASRPHYYGYYAPPPVYAAPPPVYVAPPPVYAAPAPVYVAPGPVYVAPPPVYYSYHNQHDPAGCGPGTHVC
jgi:hypothetical protein